MGATKEEPHRSGVFKQTNKQHKTGRHRSKGVIDNEQKGKQSSIKMLSKPMKKNLGKEARKHQLSQIRKKKREEILTLKRNLGGSNSAPHLICIVPLQSYINMEDIVSIVKSMDETVNIATSPCGVIHIGIPKFKQRFSIAVSTIGNIFATLDIAKVANTVFFVTSVTNDARGEVIDDWGKEIITSCLAQGLPATVVAVHNIQKLHIKKRQEYKQSVQAAISKWIPDEKVFELDNGTDCLNILRRTGSQKQRSLFYRDKRPHLLAEKFSFKYDGDSSDVGIMSVTGYLRGSLFSVNSLVHIPGFGDFQMSSIEAPQDPYSIDPVAKCKSRSEFMSEVKVEKCTHILQIAEPKKQESLENENIPDPMDAEQTWPTEEELAEAAAKVKKKIVKLVPKGISPYQASWIPDDNAESLDSDSDSESEDKMLVEEIKSTNSDSDENVEDDEYETITISEAPLDKEHYDKDIDVLEEEQALKKWEEAKLDAQFPDEVDTPKDTLAKTRFQKYRGLESFRTSPWDPKENLPVDYARIFQFENFDRMRKRVYKEHDNFNEGIQPGLYITINIIRVSSEIFKTFATMENQPLVVFGLLPYENKMSLLNIMLKHAHNHEQPIKSKDRLVFQCGFRRFAACPIFSQHTNGNKHKYERYFHPESTIVASMYAPITFPPCPTLCYAEDKNKKLELVAFGSVLSSNPDRIVVKRAVLSGYPFKVNKRSAVIRFMFFFPEDIKWFKPIELRTKYGRKGHIKEPLGTHGHMKCVFNGQLKSQDTVLMNLYKRVFPKWTYESLLLTPPTCHSEMMQIE